MRPVDKLIAGYIVFLSAVILARWEFSLENLLLLLMHGLVGGLILLFTKIRESHRIGRVLHRLYPLLLLPTLYTELGVLTMQRDLSSTFGRDAVVQGWESAIFGSQICYEWIRRAPSVFWSGVFHLAYMLYYPIILAGPLLLTMRKQHLQAQNVLFTTMLAFVACYVVFALYPVAGPNYTFEHPTGAVREVWSARMVYGLLGTGSSFGTAFPSSHVAATVAANLALWREWRGLAVTLLIPTILLVVGTVYCQMHYGVDAVAGLGVGIAVAMVGYAVARGQDVDRD